MTSPFPPVPFLDLGALARRDRDLINEAFARVVDSGWFILGREVQAFEEEFAAWCGTRHCVAVGNGLDALTLQFRAAGLQPGDEVLVPSHTYIASALGVTGAGLRAIPVECDPVTFSICARAAEQAVGPRTRAILVVHLYGRVAPVEPLEELCERRGLLLFEDCAQSHGAREPGPRGRRCGTFGHAAAFSFYPGKNLGALGDGGAVTTNDDELADRLRSLRNYGSPKKYHHPIKGYNSRLDECQAAILRARLRLLDEDNARRAEIVRQYDASICHPQIRKPQIPAAGTHVWHLYVIRAQSAAHRNALVSHLTACGIQTIIHYPTPIHAQGAFREDWKQWHLPIATELAETVLSLPLSPIQTDQQTRRVIEALNSFEATT